jgi:hypothetical protein
MNFINLFIELVDCLLGSYRPKYDHLLHNVTRIRKVDKDIYLNYKKLYKLKRSQYKLKDLGLMHVVNS